MKDLTPLFKWRTVENDFLLPVGVIKAKFRGKWLSWLNQAYADGELKLPPDWREKDWKKVLSQIARKNWRVTGSGLALPHQWRK